jgi:MraZ protein
MDTWQQLVQQLQQVLNPYNRQHNLFLRKFFIDTAQLTLDANNRLLLPKRLANLVGIENEIVLLGAGNKIEIWAPNMLDA